jgi:hypothetical protein
MDRVTGMSDANDPSGPAFDHPSAGIGAWLPDLATGDDVIYDDLALESARLEAEIQAAKARAAAARHRAVDRTAEVRSRLRAEVAASQRRLDELDRRLEVEIDSVREAGRAEAERIIADARREVARIRSGAPGEGGDVG